MSGPGKKNCITDVPGLKVGAAEDEAVRTGVTVILPDAPATAAVDVRGGGPGARETDLLDPSRLVGRIDALVLSGGSSYGLAAADAVAARLGAAGRGFQLVARDGVPPSPIVPAAILYDLANGGDKNWGETPPYAALGAKALADASPGPALLGRVGAGKGAQAGADPGGLGAASFVLDDGAVIGAMAAVNAFGSTRMTPGGPFWAWPFEIDGEFGAARPSGAEPPCADLPADTKLAAAAPGANTTLAVVAVSTPARPTDLQRIAIMAQDGLARAIRPVHGPTDGDVVFSLSTGDGAEEAAMDPLTLTRIGAAAADCLARAIARAVHEAAKGG